MYMYFITQIKHWLSPFIPLETVLNLTHDILCLFFVADDDNVKMQDYDITNGTQLFVWDGETVSLHNLPFWPNLSLRPLKSFKPLKFES